MTHFRDHAAENRRTSMGQCDEWFIVTATNYPRIHEVFCDVSHDAGFGAGHDNYSVPTEWVTRLILIESALRALTRDERQTLAIGEETEAAEIAARSEGLTEASKFLHAFWDDWNED